MIKSDVELHVNLLLLITAYMINYIFLDQQWKKRLRHWNTKPYSSSLSSSLDMQTEP